jgi:hypothetical protein
MLSAKIYEAIKESITNVAKHSLSETPDRLCDEMARNSAQSVIMILEAEESEGTCPLCGACPLCGKGGEHVH